MLDMYRFFLNIKKKNNNDSSSKENIFIEIKTPFHSKSKFKVSELYLVLEN
jgi:hypothetical protein